MTHTDADTGPDRIVRSIEAGEITGTSRTTRWRLERAGRFPRRIQISPGGVGWLVSELQEWIRERRDNRQAEVADGPKPGTPASTLLAALTE